MTGWPKFTEGLTEHLATLPAGVVVIINEDEPLPKRCRSAQFRQLDDVAMAMADGLPRHAAGRIPLAEFDAREKTYVEYVLPREPRNE
ncbi:TY-Chap domain-containing protein [Nocardia brasiliensis]